MVVFGTTPKLVEVEMVLAGAEIIPCVTVEAWLRVSLPDKNYPGDKPLIHSRN